MGSLRQLEDGAPGAGLAAGAEVPIHGPMSTAPRGRTAATRRIHIRETFHSVDRTMLAPDD